MKLVLKLAVLVCLSCTALHAAQFLVLIQCWRDNNTNYIRAEQWGGQYLVADTPGYTGLDIRFILEDTWTGTPGLEAGDPCWIRGELNNMYWRQATDHKVRADQPYPSAAGTEAFTFSAGSSYSWYSGMRPNTVIWPGSWVYAANYPYGTQFWSNSYSTYKITLLAVYE